jgi:hypothetical protein
MRSVQSLDQLHQVLFQDNLEKPFALATLHGKQLRMDIELHNMA